MRYKFSGPSLQKKRGESASAYKKRLEEARADARIEFDKNGGPLEWLSKELEDYSVISNTQRKATAKVITENNPDVMALIEIESMEALRKFNSVKYFGNKRYPYFMLIDGNDPRGIDVAVLSKYPITHIRSYISDRYVNANGNKVDTFSRDCLEIRVDAEGNPLTLFINHLKSQLQDDPVRRAKQAARVAEIVEDVFKGTLDTERFAIVGDFNQIPTDPSLKPLLEKQWQTDVLKGLPEKDRWTHVYSKDNKVKDVSQLDYVLLSKELGKSVVGQPIIERRGLARYNGLNQYFPDSAARIMKTVDKPGTEASDHCPVFVDLEIG